MARQDYPTYPELKARRVAQRRAAAIGLLRRADAMARAAGGHLVVFGSLAEGGFDEGSDIDMAILGVSPGTDAVLASELETMLALAGFAADVIPDRFLPASLRDRISRHGLDVAALG